MSIETTTPERRPCKCCGVFHDTGLCAQCHVAGCDGNKKGAKCRLQASMIDVIQLSEFQVRQKLAELQKDYAKLLEESQRLARLVAHYESKSPPGIPPASGGIGGCEVRA